jgi:DNA-binding GntR family transcriptional regulator
MLPVSTAARVADALREQLTDGLLPPGSRLPEEAIGEALGVSRNTLREAFVQLAGERLVVRQPNRGVFVAELSPDDVADLYRVRRVVEIGAVRSGGSPLAVGAVRGAVDEGRRAHESGDGRALGTANQHFHRALVALAGSNRLNAVMNQVLAEMRLVFHTVLISGEFHDKFLPDNEQICAHIEAGEFGAAADALGDYLDRSERELLAGMTPPAANGGPASSPGLAPRS